MVKILFLLASIQNGRIPIYLLYFITNQDVFFVQRTIVLNVTEFSVQPSWKVSPNYYKITELGLCFDLRF